MNFMALTGSLGREIICLVLGPVCTCFGCVWGGIIFNINFTSLAGSLWSLGRFFVSGPVLVDCRNEITWLVFSHRGMIMNTKACSITC